MTTVVACSLPAGLIIEYAGTSVRLNGAHVGTDMEDMPRNGAMPDNENRQSGFGLTVLDGNDEDAFNEWYKEMTVGDDGKPLAHPFEPIAKGFIIVAKSMADAKKEADKGKLAIAGIDTATDLPEGMEADTDTKKGK